MVELMVSHDRCAGLAANQVGLDIPLFVMLVGGEPEVVYRPRILQKSLALVDGTEECLSLPGFCARRISRHRAISVDFIAWPNNKRKKLELFNLDARVFQHEYDHLEGMTIFDHVGVEVMYREPPPPTATPQLSAPIG